MSVVLASIQVGSRVADVRLSATASVAALLESLLVTDVGLALPAVPPGGWCLCASRKPLDDKRSLSDQNIVDGSLLELMPRQQR